MEWPTATVVLGLLATVMVTVIQLVPRPRKNERHDEYATKVEHTELATRVARVEAAFSAISERMVRIETMTHTVVDQCKSTHTSLHELRNLIHEHWLKGAKGT